jgi:hypothetical protein
VFKGEIVSESVFKADKECNIVQNIGVEKKSDFENFLFVSLLNVHPCASVCSKA